MRRRVYEILTTPRPGDVVGHAISLSLLVLIIVNVAASVLETDVELARRAPRFFAWFETFSVIVFTAEYVLRLWSCTVDPRFAGAVRGRARMALTPVAIIDLVAIAPFYVAWLLPGMVDLRFLRALRLLRMFRLLRVPKLADAFGTLTRVVQDKHVELAVSLAIVFISVLVAAGTIYVVEREVPGTQFTSIPHAMWWSVETITTIGYGDIIPATPGGKVIASITGFIGICAVALPVGILTSGFMEEAARKKHASSSATSARTCSHCGHATE